MDGLIFFFGFVVGCGVVLLLLLDLLVVVASWDVGEGRERRGVVRSRRGEGRLVVGRGRVDFGWWICRNFLLMSSK